MRLTMLMALLFTCLGSLSTVFAQDATTHSGFAVVTVVSGNVAGLVLTESLKSTTSSTKEQDNVAPSPLILSASIVVNVAPAAQNTTAIALSNPSMGSGGVNLILTDRSGVAVLNTVVQLGPRGQFSRFLHELFPVQPVEFSSPLLLTLSSEIPLAILAVNFRGADFATTPLTSLSPVISIPPQPLSPATTTPGGSVSIGGANSRVFAMAASGGGWSTEIAIGNSSTAQQIVRIDFFGSNGVNTASIPDIVIPPRGVFFFSSESASAAIL